MRFFARFLQDLRFLSWLSGKIYILGQLGKTNLELWQTMTIRQTSKTFLFCIRHKFQALFLSENEGGQFVFGNGSGVVWLVASQIAALSHFVPGVLQTQSFLSLLHITQIHDGFEQVIELLWCRRFSWNKIPFSNQATRDKELTHSTIVLPRISRMQLN